MSLVPFSVSKLCETKMLKESKMSYYDVCIYTHFYRYLSNVIIDRHDQHLSLAISQLGVTTVPLER